MSISRSGLIYWNSRNKSEREKDRERLIPKVKMIHKEVRGAYGARRLSEELTNKGENCGRTKVSTLMQLANMAAMIFNSRRRHSYLGYLSPNDFEKIMALKSPPKKSVLFYLTTSYTLDSRIHTSLPHVVFKQTT
ncbi:IS3 family transposase [Desulfosediminicola flagellatus]|uniref:IS3 family transposase n=1 Tax=Desulfosediminicola flagellatus TaxID=2569541 RepID=UPI0010AC1F6F|nr:IS3 family transposase [Desulfosediminicola flagellatus]